MRREAQDDTASGSIFVSPQEGDTGQGGSLTVDDGGQVAWFRPLRGTSGRAMNFGVQTYRGEQVLTWGETPGVYIIFDGSYREIARFGAANGYNGDHHVFLISPQDTALITIYNGVPKELSSIGGTKDGLAVQGIVQELDIETGRLLFEWKSLEHVGLDESYGKPGEDLDYPGIDYFHIYSIDVDHDDNLLISARDGQNEIYTISLSGGTWGNPTRLTFNAKSDKTPAFSPNGKKIVWERGEYLYLMNADGTSQHKIPNTFHSNYEIGRYGSFGGNPAFSRNLPGGNKIIVVRDPSSPSLKGRLHGRPSKYIGYWASGCQGW